MKRDEEGSKWCEASETLSKRRILVSRSVEGEEAENSLEPVVDKMARGIARNENEGESNCQLAKPCRKFRKWCSLSTVPSHSFSQTPDGFQITRQPERVYEFRYWNRELKDFMILFWCIHFETCYVHLVCHRCSEEE